MVGALSREPGREHTVVGVFEAPFLDPAHLHDKPPRGAQTVPASGRTEIAWRESFELRSCVSDRAALCLSRLVLIVQQHARYGDSWGDNVMGEAVFDLMPTGDERSEDASMVFSVPLIKNGHQVGIVECALLITDVTT